MKLHRKSAFYGATISMISLMSCASVTYKYYGLTVPDTCYAEGSLLGKLGVSGWQDLPFSECEPDASLKGKCVVELAADHFAKETALEQCQSDLKNCQAP